jgi:hypothetical protein
MRPRLPICGLVACVLLTPVAARAQAAVSDGRHPWIVVGGGSTTLSGDCTDCEEGNYQHTGDVLVNAGVSARGSISALKSSGYPLICRAVRISGRRS